MNSPVELINGKEKVSIQFEYGRLSHYDLMMFILKHFDMTSVEDDQWTQQQLFLLIRKQEKQGICLFHLNKKIFNELSAPPDRIN